MEERKIEDVNQKTNRRRAKEGGKRIVQNFLYSGNDSASFGEALLVFFAMVVFFGNLSCPTNPHIFSSAAVPTGVVIVFSHAHALLRMIMNASKQM